MTGEQFWSAAGITLTAVGVTLVVVGAVVYGLYVFFKDDDHKDN